MHDNAGGWTAHRTHCRNKDVDGLAGEALETTCLERRETAQQRRLAGPRRQRCDPSSLLENDRAGLGDIDAEMRGLPPAGPDPPIDEIGSEITQRLPSADDPVLPLDQFTEFHPSTMPDRDDQCTGPSPACG